MSPSFLNNADPKAAKHLRDILRLCTTNDALPIAEIAKELELSVPTVTKFIMQLMDEGFLTGSGKADTSGGRKPMMYCLNPDAGYFVGIDIARRHFHISVTDFKGKPVCFIQDIEFVLEANADSFKNISTIIKQEVIKAGIPWERVIGAGVSLSGRVNPEEGYSLSFFINERIPLKALFQNELGVPVCIENDSRAMTYGEYLSTDEVRRKEKNMLFINISWGLGMGMVAGGRLYYGKSGYSGEIGHFPLLDNGKICRCGKIGCLETGASGQALKVIIEEQLAKGRKSMLSTKVEDGGFIDLEEILAAIDAGDMLAIEGIGEVGALLGRAIAGLMNLFNPGLVVIGGRLIVAGDYLMLPVRTAVNKYSMNKISAETNIRFSNLGRSAASIGACLIARDNLLGLI